MTVFCTSSGLASPKISIASTCNSTDWPEPIDSINVPVIDRAEAVVIRFKSVSSNFSKTTTSKRQIIFETSPNDTPLRKDE